MKIISDYFTLCPRQVWYNRGMRNFMNKKELLKKIISEVCVNGNITVKFASQRLGFSEIILV